MESKLRLWRFNLDKGGYDNLQGLFIATKEDIDNSMGFTIRFSDVFSRGIYIEGELYDGNFEMLDVTPETIKDLLKTNKNRTICGYNPLDYVKNDDFS